VLTIACEQCQRLLRLNAENLGQAVQCPACGRVQIPGSEPGPGLDQFAAVPLPNPATPDWPASSIAACLPSPAAEPDAAEIPRPIECPYCAEWMPVSASLCPSCQRAVDDASLQEVIRRMDERRRALNVLSFVCGLPGIYLLFVAEVFICTRSQEPERFDIALATLPAWLSWPASLFGPELAMTLTLMVGLLLTGIGVGLAAKYKGHSAAYGLLVLLCFLGFFILPFLVGDKDGGMLERLRRTLLRRAGLDDVWTFQREFQRDSSSAEDDGP
jgi:hypothetical protein